MPNVLGNGVTPTNKPLVAFSIACDNIATHENDTCMRLFVNSLDDMFVSKLFDLID